jgi:alginate O-acetyltransferase complex protein AlgI
VIFTSYTYIFFLLVVFFIYWGLPPSLQKLFLVMASYIFYCSWNWQFGFLLLWVSVFNWAYGRWVVSKAQSTLPLFLGIIINLSPLIYFKYKIFIFSNIVNTAHILGLNWHIALYEMVLPLGISFFTFQGIAYLIDVASGETPFLSIIDFMLFKAFWPQLIAGPIIRSEEIREQIQASRSLDYDDVSLGCRRILFGFFKKVVLADTLASSVDMVFLPNIAPNAVDSVFGALAFGLQIYFDFSAYSDIAIGTARLFGFVFPENFDWPYLARSPQEFWNRWHRTLSRWIRDYILTPLTFTTRHQPNAASLCLVVTMVACGLWHGARWTFVIWGLWHGLLLVLNHTLLKSFFRVSGDSRQVASDWRSWMTWLVTFIGVTLGWILFRAETFFQAWSIFCSIITLKGGLQPAVLRENLLLLVTSFLLGLFLLQNFNKWEQVLSRNTLTTHMIKPVLYALLTIAVIIFDKEATAFVYFQF